MRVILRLLALLCLGTVLAGLLIDLTPLETSEPAFADKIVHALLFALVSICLAILLPSLTAPALMMVTVAAGAATELLQGLVGRDPSWGDLIANIVGAGLVLSVTLALRRRRDRRVLAAR